MTDNAIIERYQIFAYKSFGFKFTDPEILLTAFTHRSYVNEHRSTAKVHNERLEFLGDAVLELTVTEFLYRSYSDPEGVLTSWRAALVRTESISAASTKLGFEDMLRLSRGERRGSERARHQILANTFEAVIGAIYLDQGYQAAEKFITDTILATFDEILRTGSWRDPKSHLQEVVQNVEGVTPVYKVLAEEGPDHDKIFTLGVFVRRVQKGKGTGPSKQAAQQKAAEDALGKYKGGYSSERRELL